MSDFTNKLNDSREQRTVCGTIDFARDREYFALRRAA
jgi:hypothetical protein